MSQEYVDEIGNFFVVTKPTKDSEICDILFETNIKGMMKQSLGGLKSNDILLITKNADEANEFAEFLLEKYRKDAKELAMIQQAMGFASSYGIPIILSHKGYELILRTCNDNLRYRLNLLNAKQQKNPIPKSMIKEIEEPFALNRISAENYISHIKDLIDDHLYLTN